MENTNFLVAMRRTGFTAYKTAKRSGVSYTVVHKLKTGGMDINACSGTVLRKLSVCLNTTIEEIMNPVVFLNGIRGAHRGIPYQWGCENHETVLNINDHGKQVKLSTGKFYNIPANIKDMPFLADYLIDDYLLEKTLAEGAVFGKRG